MNFATLVALAAGPVMLDAAPPPERPYRLVIQMHVGPAQGVYAMAWAVPPADPIDGFAPTWGVDLALGTLTWAYAVRVVVERHVGE